MNKYYDLKYIKLRDYFLRDVLKEIIVDKNKSYEDKKNEIYKTIMNFYSNTTTPLFSKFYVSKVPDIEKLNDTIRNIYIDELCLSCEIDNAIKTIAEDNENHLSIKKSIESEINETINSIKTVKFAMKNEGNNIIVFTDDFNNDYNINKDKTNCTIDTRNGIAYLDVVNQKNIAKECEIIEIETNGNVGENRKISFDYDSATETKVIGKAIFEGENDEKKNINTVSFLTTQTIKNAKFIKSGTNNVSNILDAKDDSVFEIEQIVCNKNILEEYTGLYDCEDIMIEQDLEKGYKLKTSITIDMKNARTINAIQITPQLYHGDGIRENKPCWLNDDKIEISNDNINYINILEQPVTINELTTSINQTFYDINSYTKQIKNEMFEKGYFIFEPIEARYIKIYLSTKDSHRYIAGHTRIIKYATDSNGNIIQSSRAIVKKEHAPIELMQGNINSYISSNGVYYEKQVIALECNKRYVISLKGIEIYSNEYKESCQIISKEYNIPANKSIKRVALYTDEYIPKSITKNKAKINSIIEYFISFDEIEWIKIMPSHKMPFTNEDAEIPKIIEINTNDSIKLNTFNYNATDKIQKIYLKAILNTGKDNIMETPVLKRYTIKAEIE